MKRLTLALSAAAIGAAGFAVAESHVDPTIAAAIEARQAHMGLYAYNLGVLGGMAQDKIEYDADMASAAAANVLALATMDQSRYWPQGSDTSVEGSAALPELWANIDDAISKGQDLAMAAEAMNVAAGQGLDELKAAMGGLGGACGACHRSYRQRDE